jgi:hypothetical protein
MGNKDARRMAGKTASVCPPQHRGRYRPVSGLASDSKMNRLSKPSHAVLAKNPERRTVVFFNNSNVDDIGRLPLRGQRRIEIVDTLVIEVIDYRPASRLILLFR